MSDLKTASCRFCGEDYPVMEGECFNNALKLITQLEAENAELTRQLHGWEENEDKYKADSERLEQWFHYYKAQRAGDDMLVLPMPECREELDIFLAKTIGEEAPHE